MFGTLFLTFLTAVIGWFLTHFLARHILKVYEYREKAHELIFYTANVGALDKTAITEEERRKLQDASDQLRALAAQVAAVDAAMPFYCRRIIRCCFQYSLPDAVSGLTGLSNSLTDTQGAKANHRQKIQVAFDLPPLS